MALTTCRSGIGTDGTLNINHSLALISSRAMQFYRWRRAVPLLAQHGGNVPEVVICDNGQSI